MEILTLGEKIKAKRKELNMTLKDLAGDRITPGQISLVESGKSNPSIDLLEYLADKLDIEIDYLMESEEKQASKVCEFYSDIAEAAVNSENLIRAQEFIEKGIFYADKYILPYYKGKFEMHFSRLKYIKGMLEEAQRHCITANSLFIKTNNIVDATNSFIFLGNISLDLGYVSAALNYFIQSDTFLMENNITDELLKSKIYYHIADCYNRLNDIQHAIDYALLARERLNLLENKREYGDTLMILSIAYSQENKINEAIKYANEAKKIFEELRGIKEISDIESNLAVIFAKNNNIDESFIHFSNALRLKRQIDDDTIPETLLKLCENYIQSNDLNKAFECINEALETIHEDQHKYRIKCFEYQYKIYSKKGEYHKAEETLLQAVEYMEPLNYKRNLADFYIMLGKLYSQIDSKESALSYIDRGIELYKEMGIILSS